MTQKKYARQTRKSLKRFCPEIYELLYANLSDEDLINSLNESKAFLDANKGQKAAFAIQFAGQEQPMIIDTFTVPNKPEFN